MFQRYVAGVSYGCCKSRLGRCICCKCFRGTLQVFVQIVSSVSDVDVCCKRFLSRCCICFTPMLQEYVWNVSVVSVLCCNKCFHVAICKCVYLDVAYISHTYCNCMFQMFYLLQSYVASKCFMLQRQRVLGARPGHRGWGAASRGWQSGHAAHLGSCRRGVLVLMPALESRSPRDRGGESGEKERQARRFPQARGCPDSQSQREEGAKGEGAAYVVFSVGAHDEGGVGVWTRAFAWTTSASTSFKFYPCYSQLVRYHVMW
jgi:hypothetical protein